MCNALQWEVEILEKQTLPYLENRRLMSILRSWSHARYMERLSLSVARTLLSMTFKALVGTHFMSISVSANFETSLHYPTVFSFRHGHKIAVAAVVPAQNCTRVVSMRSSKGIIFKRIIENLTLLHPV